MDEISYVFYALTVNDHDASIHLTAEEAVEELSFKIADCDDEDYGIEPVRGIWNLIKRLGAFEGYADYWMEDALSIAYDMVQSKKDLENKKVNDNDNRKEESNG